MEFIEQIRENNKHHDVSSEELKPLIQEANKIYWKHIPKCFFNIKSWKSFL